MESNRFLQVKMYENYKKKLKSSILKMYFLSEINNEFIKN